MKLLNGIKKINIFLRIIYIIFNQMKIVALVPIKSKSKRVKNKNFLKISGKPLYQFLLDKLSDCKFDEIYIDSDSKIIEKIFKKKVSNL